MKFIEWKLLEMMSKSDLRKEAEKIKDLISKKYNSLYYYVTDFTTFTRPNEPEQKSILFTEDGSTSFSLNFTSKGDVYSIDIFKNNAKPIITYYIENGTIEDVANIAPKILKNPKEINGIKPKKMILQENNDEIKITSSDPKPKTIIDPEITKIESEYDYSDPETIFEDLASYVEMVIKGIQPSLLITGSSGVGKTHTVKSVIQKYNLKKDVDYVHIKGRGTPAGLFIALYEYNGKLIVFDDCDSIFNYGDSVNILKGALDSYEEREISWLVGRPLSSEGKKLPKSFLFNGKIIFISNLPQRKIDDAIKSRSFMLEVALTPDDMLKKMKNELHKVHTEIPLYIREEALETIEDVYKSAKNLELNMRTLVKAIKILNEVTDLKVARRLILQQCSYK